MIVEKIQLRSIKLESLNAECLLAVNRCVRYIKQEHEISLKLQDKDVLIQLSKHVRRIDDEALNGIYQDLKVKMVSCVTQARKDGKA